MISQELSSVRQNQQVSAQLADQVAQFLAAGGRIQQAERIDPKPLPPRREDEPAPIASKRARTAAPIARQEGERMNSRAARRAELAPAVREMAKTLNISQIASRLGVDRNMLRTIGREYGISYAPAPTGAQIAAQSRDRVFAERLQAFIRIGLTKRQACMRSGLGYRAFNRVCKAFNLQFPEAPEGS